MLVDSIKVFYFGTRMCTHPPGHQPVWPGGYTKKFKNISPLNETWGVPLVSPVNMEYFGENDPNQLCKPQTIPPLPF